MIVTVGAKRLLIKDTLLNEPPYISLKFDGVELTDIQKELIYRAYLEKLVDEKCCTKGCIKDIIKCILLNEYDSLCSLASYLNFSVISSYLLSKSLVVNKTFPVTLRICPHCEKSKYAKYYFSFIDRKVLENNNDIFPILQFSRHVKYSSEFINDNFCDFIDNFGQFPGIEIQEPSFDTLIKHIDEFIIDDDMQLLFLSSEQRDKLKLLNKILAH